MDSIFRMQSDDDVNIILKKIIEEQQKQIVIKMNQYHIVYWLEKKHRIY